MFLLWWRMDEEDRQLVWPLYGWFSGLMCVGSVFGAVTWGAQIPYLVAIFTPGLTTVQFQSLAAQAQYWFAAFSVTYAVDFLCLSVAKLMVLHRMVHFALPKADSLWTRLSVGGRVVMSAVVVGNVVGLCSNVAAAVLSKQAGDLYSAAAAAAFSNNTDSYTNFNSKAYQKSSDADVAASVQQFCEVVVLLIIILAFAIVGIAGFRRVSSALRDLNDSHKAANAAGRQLRQHIVGTAAFVFVTFLLRTIFSIMNAVSNALQNYSAACAANATDLCDPTCFNVWQLMQIWLIFTPEFQLIVVLISSPLAMLVALWGMTSKRTLQYMRCNCRQMVAIDDSSNIVLRTRG